MSLHATSTVRGRKVQRVGFFTLALSAMLALWLAVSGQLALAADPPPANANAKSVTTNEDTLISIDTGIAFDNRYQVVIIAPGPVHGTLAVSGAAPGNFKIDYTPGANQTAPVSFSYQICTTSGSPVVCGQSASVTVSITPVNDPPQAVTDSATVLYSPSAADLQSVLIPVLSNDTGGLNEGDSVSLISITTPGVGTAVIENGQVRYTAPVGVCPGALTPNPVTFFYQTQDSSGNQSTGTINVTVKCPGSPTLKLGAPYGFSGHTFKVDVILESVDVNVAAVDFYLNYGTCVTEPDSPTDNKLADDTTTILPAGSFLFQSQDTDAPPAPGILHVIAASTTNPASILAGPGASTTRTIATVQFKAMDLLPANIRDFCTPAAFTITNIGGAGNPGFTGTGGTPIDGTGSAQLITLSGGTPNLALQLNKAPTNMALSPNTAPENSPVNTFVGKVSTTDPDGDTDFHYVVFDLDVNGNVVATNGNFRVRNNVGNGDELVVNATGLASGSYKIRIRVTDPYGATFEKDFTVELTDVNHAPTAVNDGSDASPIVVNGPTSIDVLLGTTPGSSADSDSVLDFPIDTSCTNCSIVSVTNGSKGVVVNLGKTVRYIPTDPNHYSIDTGNPATSILVTDIFTYTMTDNDAPNALTSKARVIVKIYPEQYPAGHPFANQIVKLGDCNASGSVEAGDLTATGLEIFDGDGNAWYDIYKGSRTAFSPRGCNSNQDLVLDAGDISCTARRIFGQTCGAVVAAGSSKATLEVASGLRVANGASVKVPVLLRGNGNAADTAVFALTFDPAKFSFNADADAVSLSSGTLTMVNYDAATGRVEIVVTGMTATDGEIAAIRLTASESASGDVAISLADSSLGNEGASVAVETADGSVQIGGATFRALLPLVRK